MSIVRQQSTRRTGSEAPEEGWASGPADSGSDARQVVFRVDYGMVGHGLAPLFVEGRPTEMESWGLSSDTVRRLRRLNELYDRQINWDDPADSGWRMPEQDRNEFNALLPFVVSELQVALGDRWQIVVESQPI